MSDLTLELPTLERAGAGGGQVTSPALGVSQRGFLRLRVTPRRPRAGRTTRLRVTVTSYGCKGCKGKRARGAKVVFAGKRFKTGAKGQKTVRVNQEGGHAQDAGHAERLPFRLRADPGAALGAATPRPRRPVQQRAAVAPAGWGRARRWRTP